MSKKKSRQQEKQIRKIWNEQSPFYALLALAFFASVILLSSAEHPKYWDEREIVISDVSKVHIYRGSYYQITDTNGATYSVDSSNDNVKELVCGKSYHIIYANIHWNRIKYMTDSNTVYVDYDTSVEDYYTRTMIGCAGILISTGAIIFLIRKSLGKIKAVQRKK